MLWPPRWVTDRERLYIPAKGLNIGSAGSTKPTENMRKKTMTDKLEIPDEHRFAFNRLVRKMPADIRENATFRRTMLLYLKVGGEKLALAGIKALVTPFTEKFVLKKSHVVDEDLVANTTTAGEASGEAAKKDDEVKVEDTTAN